jgi:2-dehydro-3-deoxyphosphogluconate aldolase/(4S)-4-hydroxy-2-oxoglutarate aldolase
MQRTETLAVILRERVIGIVRLGGAERVIPTVEAIHAGGVRCIEVSLTTPGALTAIRALRDRLPDALLGAGTVCSPEDAAAAVHAGASYLVTPVTLPELIPLAHSLDVPIAMGAFTPTEIHLAHRAGADLVKLFPASSLDPGYLRAVRAPFPGLRLVPTGGVGIDNARSWLAAGAVALGIGGGLTSAAAIAAGDFARLSDFAERLMQSIRDEPLPSPIPPETQAR